MQNDVQIRLAVTAEADRLARVLYESFVEYEPLYTPEGFAATALTAEKLLIRMNEGPLWAAVLDGKIVGTGSVVDKGDHIYVRGMAVVPAARGHRIGELLLEEISKFAIGHGRERLVLSTTPFLASAIRLYERAGFVRSDVGPEHLFGTPLFTMVKVLRK